MQTAQRAGCALTATRLQLAKRVLEEQVVRLPGPPAGHSFTASASSGSASSSSAPAASAAAAAPTPVGAFAIREADMALPEPGSIPDPLRLRDQTDFHHPIMDSYKETAIDEIGKPAGPLGIGFDGVMADVLGELNQYWVVAPARPWSGLPERSAWMPIQDHALH
jgi:hypothetical protein